MFYNILYIYYLFTVGQQQAAGGREEVHDLRVPGPGHLHRPPPHRPDRRHQARLHQLRPRAGRRGGRGQGRQRQVRHLHGQEARRQGLRSARGYCGGQSLHFRSDRISSVYIVNNVSHFSNLDFLTI